VMLPGRALGPPYRRPDTNAPVRRSAGFPACRTGPEQPGPPRGYPRHDHSRGGFAGIGTVGACPS